MSPPYFSAGVPRLLERRRDLVQMGRGGVEQAEQGNGLNPTSS